MAEILTNNFNSDLNRLFVLDTKNNQDYYMFVSTIGNFNPVDSAVSQNEFLENTLFGKKIKNEDINFMIRYYPWQRGTVYTQYDDTLDLDGLNFYAVVGPNDNDTGDYRVYKCLDNDNGATAESPPTYDDANVKQIYETADGYVWKYMYRLTTLQFEAYNALGYIPIDPNATVSPANVEGGGISDIEVTNALENRGYLERTGVIYQQNGRQGAGHGEVDITVTPGQLDWPRGANTMVGEYIYVTNPSSSVTNLFVIDYYDYNQSTNRASIRVNAEVANPSVGDVEGATQANPVVITSTDHNLVNGQPIRFFDVGGMTELNDDDKDGNPVYYVTVIDDDTFSLQVDAGRTVNLNGSAFGAYTSGGRFNADKDLITAGVLPGAGIKIFPRLDIQGDGVGAVAIPELDNDVINKVTVLNRGSGYNNVIATIPNPNYFDPSLPESDDIQATLRVIVEPEGGHSYNLIDEFRCKHFSFYAYITAEDNTFIGDSNTYGAIGIVRDPTFRTPGATWRTGQANTATMPDVFDNRIAITTDDYASVTSNTVIRQTNSKNEVTFVAQVHEIDASSNTIFLAEYMGPYVNNKAIGNGDTSFNPNQNIITDNNQQITINNPVANNVVYSDYIQRTGEVYFMEDFFPLARTDLSREEFKFVLEF